MKILSSKEYTSKYPVLILEQQRPLAPGGRLRFAGNTCVGFTSLLTGKTCTSFNIGGIIGFIIFFYLKHIRLKFISTVHIVWTPFNSKNKTLYTCEAKPNKLTRNRVSVLILMLFLAISPSATRFIFFYWSKSWNFRSQNTFYFYMI